MAKKFPIASKMTNEALIEEYAQTDKRFFSLRTRNVENELSNRGFWTVNKLDNVMLNTGLWRR